MDLPAGAERPRRQSLARSLVSRLFRCASQDALQSGRPEHGGSSRRQAARRNPHRRSTGQLDHGNTLRKTFPISALTLLVNLKRDSVAFTGHVLAFTIDSLSPSILTVTHMKKGTVVSEMQIAEGLNQNIRIGKIEKTGIYCVRISAKTDELDASVIKSQETRIELHRVEGSSGAPLLSRIMSQTVFLDSNTSYNLLEIYGRPSSRPLHILSADDLKREGEGDVVNFGNEGARFPPKVEERECVVCLTLERDTIVLPCRHLCLCAECAESLRSRVDKCPICRECCQGLLQVKLMTSSDDEAFAEKIDSKEFGRN